MIIFPAEKRIELKRVNQWLTLFADYYNSELTAKLYRAVVEYLISFETTINTMVAFIHNLLIYYFNQNLYDKQIIGIDFPCCIMNMASIVIIQHASAVSKHQRTPIFSNRTTMKMA